MMKKVENKEEDIEIIVIRKRYMKGEIKKK